MSWTKGELVSDAFAGIGMPVELFNVSPDDIQLALRSLDTMMAAWYAKGIRVGYPLPSSANGSSTNDDSGLPDAAYEGVIASLEIRIAPRFGKSVSPETRLAATEGYNALLMRAAFPPQQQLPDTLPRGAGNKPWRGGFPRPFQPTPIPPVTASAGGDVIVLNTNGEQPV